MKTIDRYETVLRLYDKPTFFDRYTVVPPRWAKEYAGNFPGQFMAIGASEYPYSPQGFGQTVTVTPGNHLGKRIKWSDLPEGVKRFSRDVFPEYCPKESE